MKSHLRVKHPNEYEQYVRRMKEFKKEQVNLVVITRSLEH
jgi:hypothetical protein